MLISALLGSAVCSSQQELTDSVLTVQQICQQLTERDDVKRLIEAPLGKQLVLLTGTDLNADSIEAALERALVATWTTEGSVRKLGRTAKQRSDLSARSDQFFKVAFNRSRPQIKLPVDPTTAATEIRASYLAYVQNIHNQLELPSEDGYTRPRFSNHFEELTEALLQRSMPLMEVSANFFGRSAFTSERLSFGTRLAGTESALRRYDSLRSSLRNLLGNEGDVGDLAKEHLGQAVFGNLGKGFETQSCTLIRTGKIDEYQVQTLVSSRPDVPLTHYYDGRRLVFDGPKEADSLSSSIDSRVKIKWSDETLRFYSHDTAKDPGTLSRTDFLGRLTRDVLAAYGRSLSGPMMVVLPDTAELALAKKYRVEELDLSSALVILEQGRLGLRKEEFGEWTIVRPQDIPGMELSRIPRESIRKLFAACLASGKCSIEDLGRYRYSTTDVQGGLGLQRYVYDLQRHKRTNTVPVLATPDDELICGELLSFGQFRNGVEWSPVTGSARFQTACKLFALTSPVDSKDSGIEDVQAGLASGKLHWETCRFRLDISSSPGYQVMVDGASRSPEILSAHDLRALVIKEQMNPDDVLVHPGTRRRIRISANFDGGPVCSDEFWDTFDSKSEKPVSASKVIKALRR